MDEPSMETGELKCERFNACRCQGCDNVPGLHRKTLREKDS
jgi:hypothetical protein